MKTSDYIADQLSKITDYVFGVTGGCIQNLVDSIGRHPDIEYIPMNHEQGAAIAADAYARLSGKIGVCIATSGPGAINTLTGLACSYFDSVPVMAIVGQSPTTHLSSSTGPRQIGFQEVDIVAMATPVTKWSARILDAEDTPKMLQKAYLTAIQGRPGPTLLDLPDDVQRAEIDRPDWSVGGVGYKPRDAKDSADKIMEALHEAKKPVIVLGHGIRIAGMVDRAEELVDKWGIPVLLTWGALDILDHNHPLNFRDFGVTGSVTGNKIIQEADLIIGFGTRFDTHEIGVASKKFNPTACKIVVDIDICELSKYPWQNIRADIRDVIPELLTRDYAGTQWACRVDYDRPSQGELDPYVFLDRLSDVAPDDAIIIADAGCTVTWTMQAWKVKRGQRLFTAFNLSPMGYALPASIGAHYATGRPIISISGDGGTLMNMQELAVIEKRNLPIKTFILDNGGYGMIKQTQETWADGRYIGSHAIGFTLDRIEDGISYFKKNAGDVSIPDIQTLWAGIDCWAISCEEDMHRTKCIWSDVYRDRPLLFHVLIDQKARVVPRIRYGQKLEEIA